MENAHSTKEFVINSAASSRPSSPSHKRMDQRSTATNITNEIEARKATNRWKKRKINGRKIWYSRVKHSLIVYSVIRAFGLNQLHFNRSDKLRWRSASSSLVFVLVVISVCMQFSVLLETKLYTNRIRKRQTARLTINIPCRTLWINRNLPTERF